MISLYEEYLSAPQHLTMDEMHALHRKLVEELGDDEDSKELYRELLNTAARYLAFRANWRLWSREEKMERGTRARRR